MMVTGLLYYLGNVHRVYVVLFLLNRWYGKFLQLHVGKAVVQRVLAHVALRNDGQLLQV